MFAKINSTFGCIKEDDIMNRVIVKCKQRRPERVFDILIETNGDIVVEMKFPGSSNVERIKINEHLKELGVINK